MSVLRTIGYNASIEDTNGNEIDEKALKMGDDEWRAIKLFRSG
jgi:hypothetical protein